MNTGKLTIYPDTRFTAFCLAGLMASITEKKYFRKADLNSHPALFPVDARMLLDTALRSPCFAISRESVAEEVISIAGR